MEVLDAQVDFNLGYGNDPDLQVCVDEIPSRDEMVFESANDKTLWYAEMDGYARFFAGHPDKDGNGYAGREYTLPTADGSVTLTGPYSSRASALNKNGFGPVVDVEVTTSPDAMDKGFTFCAGAITVEKAQDAVDMIDGVSLEREIKYDSNEPRWILRVEDGYVVAVDNNPIPFKFTSTRSQTASEIMPKDESEIRIKNDDYAVCVDVYEYSDRDWWVVPVSRDENGDIVTADDSRFVVEDERVVQTDPIYS